MTVLAQSYRGERHARLASGLVLLVFLLAHCTNLALGLVSVHVMDVTRPWLMGIWRSPPGTIVLAGALGVHFMLALLALYRRRTWRMSGREALQLGFGLALPFLLVTHVLNTRIAPMLTGQGPGFADEVYSFWVANPLGGLRQLAALMIAWGHGCLGLWFWLRFRRWAPRVWPVLLPAAVLVPLMAILGFAEAGKEVARGPAITVDAAVASRMLAIASDVDLVLAGVIALVLVARLVAFLLARRRRVRIEYADGKTVAVPLGFTVLEASRTARIPHAAVCGGRGRCSTCRIRVVKGAESQPPPRAVERVTLARIGADADVRLACQLRPTHDLAIYPILSSAASKRRMPSTHVRESGVEREIGVLFCDLRAFTRRAEHMLPYDTVFVLNRYFEMVGEAVEASGGHLDKFIGDGALALFGLAAPIETASRNALDAMVRIARGLDALNTELEGEIDEPLRVAMGIHVGRAIVGDMGFGRATSLTAVGDCINVASRLETAAKEFDVEAIVSTSVMTAIGATVPFEHRTIEVRGRSRTIDAYLLPRAIEWAAHAELE